MSYNLSTPGSKLTPFLMWSIPVLFFAFQFILRLWPSLMMQDIMQQLAINASGFGVVAAFYYYGYAGAQIPIAFLLDKFGARLIICACAVVAGVAMLIFCQTDNWYLACLCRFLIGVGSAAGFLGVSKVTAEWFPKSQFSRMIGFSFTIGLMGALYGGRPVSILVDGYGVHWVTMVLTFAAVSIGITALLFLRAPVEDQGQRQDELALSNFKDILTLPSIWALAFANLLMVGALEGFADVWGVSYLMEAHHFSKGQSAEIISYLYIGMLFGGPVLAAFSRVLGNFTVIMLSGLGLALAFLILLLGGLDGVYPLSILLFFVGILCCYQVIVFVAGASMCRPELLGITVAFLNCINMLGGSFFHTTIGYFMDVFWDGATSLEGVPIYGVDAYRYALLAIPFCALAGVAIVGSLQTFNKNKFTNARQSAEAF